MGRKPPFESSRNRTGSGAGAERLSVPPGNEEVVMKIARDFACDTCGSASIAPPPRLGDSDEVRCQHCKKVLMTWKVYRLLGADDAGEIAIGPACWED
jgi:hypothetical protein